MTLATNTLQLATKQDAHQIIAIIKDRMIWMDEHGIYQWTKTDFVGRYPESYYTSLVDTQNLYVMKDEDKVIGAVALFDTDEKFNDYSKEALYIHKLVTDKNYKGVGAKIIEISKQKAISQGKKYLRLDCQSCNKKLNSYYESFGFECIGQLSEGLYVGNKMEIKLK